MIAGEKLERLLSDLFMLAASVLTETHEIWELKCSIEPPVAYIEFTTEEDLIFAISTLKRVQRILSTLGFKVELKVEKNRVRLEAKYPET